MLNEEELSEVRDVAARLVAVIVKIADNSKTEQDGALRVGAAMGVFQTTFAEVLAKKG